MFISNNIKVNVKKIGVLKAIGVSTEQISNIFLLESIIISIASYIVSSVATVIFVSFVNNKFIEQIEDHKFQYLYWNNWMALVIAALTVGLSVIAVILPVYKLSRKKPVDIIRNVNSWYNFIVISVDTKDVLWYYTQVCRRQ